MEVHHHSHTADPDIHRGRKKWTHYFWEFLMLFLAVFCGFLAEYQLEHRIEKDRERQYMQSLIKDLNQDINNIDVEFANRKMRDEIADSLTNMFFKDNFKEYTGLIYYCARRFSVAGYIFHMTDGTLMQLKNSGGLRLIHEKGVVDSLQAYYNLYQQHNDNLELEMLQLRDYRDVMVKIFDVKIFDYINKNFPALQIPQGNPPLFSNDESLINQLLMRIHLSKRINLVNIQNSANLKNKAIRLIEKIRNEYHLE